MMKQKRLKMWMSVVLIFAMLVGMAYPGVSANAAAKTKKSSQKVLVVYFSATGTTRAAAKKIKKETGGTLYQIKAADPYTSADLNYNNDNCRANVEQKNGGVRPEIQGKVKNIRKYDVIFIGYPIWWNKEPMIIRTFLESYHLKGKKIVTFCTSGGSGISGSTQGIRNAAKGATVIQGRDLTGVSYQSVAKWAKKYV